MNNRRTNIVTRMNCRWLLIALLTALVQPGTAVAADSKFSGFAEIGYLTDYLWRGQRLASDSIQPQVTEYYSDKFSVGLWGNYGLKKGPNGKYSETDLLAKYYFSDKNFTFVLGGTLYRIDDLQDPETLEPFRYYFESVAAITLKVKFSPTLTFWREFGRIQTNYLEFSLAPTFEVNKQCQIILRPHVGVFESSKHYYGTDISLNYEFKNNFYGRATVTLIRNNFPFEKHERATFGVATGTRW
jgi:hypothetical protein